MSGLKPGPTQRRSSHADSESPDLFSTLDTNHLSALTGPSREVSMTEDTQLDKAMEVVGSLSIAKNYFSEMGMECSSSIVPRELESCELCTRSSRSLVFFFPSRPLSRKHPQRHQNSKSHPSKEIFQGAAHGWYRRWEDDLRQPTSR
jgi:hypothetical protein